MSNFVKDLPTEINEAKVIELFKECGPIESVRLIYSSNTYFDESNTKQVMRTPTGAAFVNFENMESATKAIMNMNKKMVEEKQIKVMKYMTKQELKARKMAS